MMSRIPLDNVCDKKIETLSSHYDGKIEYIDISSIDNIEKTILNTQLIDSKEAPSRAKQLVKKGDILVSTVRPNLNAVAVVEKESAHVLVASTGYCVLRCNTAVNNRYVFHFCQSPYFIEDMVRQATGASYPAVSNSIVKSCLIPSRDLKEQSHIATILDRVSNLIALRKQQLDKMDELVKARFVEMFGDPIMNPKGWTLVPLLEMGDCKNGMNFHNGDFGIELHCLGVGDFKNLSAIHDTSRLSKVSLNEMPNKDYILKNGDIVFVRSNGNRALVGRCLAIYPEDTLTTFSGFCIRYRRHSTKVQTEYLLQVLKSDSIRKKMAGRGANIQNLNQQILASLDIPIPPQELQLQFTLFIEQIEKCKLTIQQGLDKLEMMKKALVQEYFG